MDNSYRWLLLFAASLILFIINVDYTALNLALIPLSSYFKTGLDTIQWVLSGYVLTWAVFVLPSGRCVDLLGQKKICLIGLSLFLLASAMAGFANSAHFLITARVLQGFAGALYTPAVYALIHTHFAAEERGRAMGIISLGIGLGMAAGPMIGGALLSWLNWRSIFLINLLIGAIALFIVALDQSKHSKTRSTTAPFLPWHLIKNATFIGCIITMLLEQYGFSSIVVSSGLFLRKIMHLSILQSSAMYLTMTTLFALISIVGGVWIDRRGLCLPITSGLCVMAVGVGLLTLLSSTTPLWMVCGVFMTIGIGMGCALTGLNAGIIKTVRAQEVGIASSIFVMFALIGNFMGVLITTHVYEKTSLASLVNALHHARIYRGFRLEPLRHAITNIGASTVHMKMFSHHIQTVIHTHWISALNHGLSAAVFLTMGLLLVAAGTCMTLMRSAGLPQPAMQKMGPMATEKIGS